MKVLLLDHVGIAVKSVEESKKFYTDVLGLTASGEEVVEEQKVKVCFIPCGESELELLESTSEDGPIARFIDKNGAGIQHVALRVDDIEATLKHMEDKGVRMIDKTPRYGAGGAKIAFVHPKECGLLLELSQRM